MKKRCLAITIALALLLSLPAMAAEAERIDAAGTVSFENLATRVRSGSPMLLAYEELIAASDTVDRAAAYKDLSESISGLSDMIWAYLQLGDTGAAWTLQEQQEQLKEQLDAYKPENYAKTLADLVKPLQALGDQLILGAESLYLNLAALEPDIARGRIELSRLERTAQETQLLHSLGRASALACEEAEITRDAASRQLDALIEKSELWKTQLQLLLGETPTGVLALAPLPEVTQDQLSGLQYDADLQAGLESNIGIYLKENAVSDAKEKWEDTGFGYHKTAAEHSYNAAVYAYEAEKQSFQQSFDTIYRSLGAAQSAVSAAQDALVCQQNVYAAAQLRYTLGMISKSTLLTAEAELSIADLAVQTANIGLASAYNSYCWARRGLLTA